MQAESTILQTLLFMSGENTKQANLCVSGKYNKKNSQCWQKAYCNNS